METRSRSTTSRSKHRNVIPLGLCHGGLAGCSEFNADATGAARVTQAPARPLPASAPRFLSDEMGRRQLAVTLGALMLCVFLAALDSSIVANALPRVIADLHGFELYAWVTTGYLLSSTAVTPVGGKLGDRYGRKRMMIGGAVFFLAMTLLCGFAQNMPQLIALRTLQGVGGGVLTA